jgi:hypothetical protein
MAMPETSEAIWTMWNDLGDAQGTEQAELETRLRAALLTLIERQLPAAAKRSGLSAGRIKAQLLENLENDLLNLLYECPEELVNTCEVMAIVDDRLDQAMSDIRWLQAAARDEENVRLAKLVRAYRDSGKGWREERALYSALLDKMRPMAAKLARDWGWTDEDAESMIGEVALKWARKKELLADWHEYGGAAISTWLYRGLIFARGTIHRKRKQQPDFEVIDAQEGENEQQVSQKRKPHVPVAEVYADKNKAALQLASSDKSPNSPIRLDELAIRIDSLIKEIVGQTVIVEDKKEKAGEVLSTKTVRLTDNHALVLSTLFQHQCPSDQELAAILCIPKATVGRWRREAFSYVKQHRSRDDLLALMEPFSSEYQPGLDSAPAI